MPKKEKTVNEQPNQSNKPKRRFESLALVTVQSIACVVVILLALMLRLIGGEPFAAVGQYLQSGLTDNTLVSAAVSLLESAVPSQKVDSPLGEAVSVAAEVATANRATSESTVCAPLIGGVVSSPFGERIDPFDETATDVHEGLDIAADEGTPIFAALSGTVEETGEEDGYGRYMIVSCENGVRYLYAHCSAVLVKQGMEVKAGEVVAKVGNTGHSTGPHLHVEWRVNGELIDPQTVLPEKTYV
ncbi:MAG: M23 family metallopeptidase [Clostridia bacterium]|nr:M23 family metallopeptidase [Clostridia bacterium]